VRFFVNGILSLFTLCFSHLVSGSNFSHLILTFNFHFILERRRKIRFAHTTTEKMNSIELCHIKWFKESWKLLIYFRLLQRTHLVVWKSEEKYAFLELINVKFYFYNLTD